MKKILLIFAAMCCMMVARALDFKVGGIKYNVTSEENKTVEVVANGYSGDVKIPATVTIEDVTYSVTRIGEHAFDQCTGLTSVTLPEGLESIGYEAFDCCENLVSINIPSTVTELGRFSFYYCISMESITLPEGLEKIGDSAFRRCFKLMSITIPSTVKSIGETPFVGCYLLESINVAEGNTVYDSRDNCNAIIVTATNTLMAGCKSTVIPSSVTVIGEDAFYGDNNLATITLPKGLTRIEEAAFEDCTSLKSLTIPSTVTYLGFGSFMYCIGLESMTVLASTPPTLDNLALYQVNYDIPVYVPDTAAYKGWGGFTNFRTIELDSLKQNAIDKINAAKDGVSLTDEESDAIDDCISTINGVETLSEENIDENIISIERAKNEALAIISQATIRPVREAAIAVIEAAMQGETSDYLDSVVQKYIGIINFISDVTAINNARNAAVEALNEVMEAYMVGKSSTFGSLGTKQSGPALIVTDRNGKEKIFYSPKRVEYVKVNDK